MNRIVVLLIFNLVIGYIFAETKDFNYYERKKNGSYVLKNIKVFDFEIPFLLHYKGIYEGGKLKKVIGYYYNDDKVKFIDDVNSRAVLKSEYFSYDKNETIMVKEYRWDNGTLYGFTMYAKVLKMGYNLLEIEENYSYENNNIVVENETFLSKGSDNKWKRVQTYGILRVDFSPMKYETLIETSDGKKDFIVEGYQYSDSNKLISYESVIPERGFLNQHSYKYENDRLINELYLDYNGTQYKEYEHDTEAFKISGFTKSTTGKRTKFEERYDFKLGNILISLDEDKESIVIYFEDELLSFSISDFESKKILKYLTIPISERNKLIIPNVVQMSY